MGSREVPSLSLWMSLYTRDRPKPLEAILSRSLNQVIPELQCLFNKNSSLQLHHKVHTWTKKSSRRLLIKVGKPRRCYQTAKLHVYQISHKLLASSVSLHEIRQATQIDDELALLKHTIMTGWPTNIREIPQILHPYWTFREELTIKDSLILKGT